MTLKSQRIALLCDADFSNRELYKKLRETTSIEDLVVIHQNSEEQLEN